MKSFANVLVVLLVVLAIAALAVRQFMFLSPAQATERMGELHAVAPELDAHIEAYSDALGVLGTPFGALSRLGGVVERVEEARAYSVDVAGVVLRPWQSIERNTPGAELVDDTMRAVSDLVRLAEAANEDLSALETAAVAYSTAFAASEAAPSNETVRAVAESARALADEIDRLRTRVAPLSTALDLSVAQVQSANEWLAGVTPEGVPQGVVLRGLAAAVGLLESGVAAPRDRISGLVAEMESDAAHLRAVAEVEDSLRSNMVARLTSR